MKILLVSMNSIHFQSWANQLKDSGHEVYWFDILDAGKKEQNLHWMNQITNWKLKFNFPFRFFLNNNLPKLYSFIKRFNENETALVFEKMLLEIQPDVLHSFALQISCIPILSVMQKHSTFKWIYSSWGSDMFYSKEIGINRGDLDACLKRIDFLITDCKRDYKIAQQKGFKNIFLGTFPGNGGIGYIENDIEYTLDNRNIILIKAYNDSIGNGINIVKAFTEKVLIQLDGFKVVIFGANKEVEDYVKTSSVFSKLNYSIYTKTNFIPNKELIKLMGKSYIYIGNSYSDGIPNTLLEAMGMGAFPIQSNPGGATSEVIEHTKNGLLISNPDDIIEIEGLIHSALTNKEMVNDALLINAKIIKDKYERGIMKSKILKMYEGIN